MPSCATRGRATTRHWPGIATASSWSCSTASSAWGTSPAESSPENARWRDPNGVGSWLGRQSSLAEKHTRPGSPSPAAPSRRGDPSSPPVAIAETGERTRTGRKEPRATRHPSSADETGVTPKSHGRASCSVCRLARQRNARNATITAGRTGPRSTQGLPVAPPDLLGFES